MSTRTRIQFVRISEFIGSLAIIVLTMLAAALGAALIVWLLMGEANGHQTDMMKDRVGNNRYLCYTQEELLKQLWNLHHSREMWHPADRALNTHVLLEIHAMCAKAEKQK